MRIYNTQTRQKEEFTPLHPGKVSLYACGPTVYNYFHIGNARPFITFDTLRRYLEYRGYEVAFVQNFTDIDDKMIKRAQEENTTVEAIAKRYIAEYWVDAQGLGVKPATHHPLATEHMDDIIGLVARLMEKGIAYAADGDVYFDTQAFPAYGKLSGQNVDDLEAGARIEVGDKKRSPMDFALWKAEKPGEPAWEAPWGKGRPGWHIECSAMAMSYLGETIDIHGGGQDLVFPHHENEKAQSEGATGKAFVRYWMHNGFINVNNEKMSKSLGNFFTVREVAKAFNLEVVRMFMLSAHYRSPVNYSPDQLEQAQSSLTRLYTARGLLRHVAQNGAGEAPPAGLESIIAKAKERFVEAMDDDLNTADALGSIFEFVREVNTMFADGGQKEAAAQADQTLTELCGVLGLLFRDDEEIPCDVLALLEERKAARAQKNWAESDRLRDAIAQLGYAVEDSRDGQKAKKT